MKRNSTLLLILDGAKGESEIIDVNEMFDRSSKFNNQLSDFFEQISFTPRKEVIDEILMKA